MVDYEMKRKEKEKEWYVWLNLEIKNDVCKLINRGRNWDLRDSLILFTN